MCAGNYGVLEAPQPAGSNKAAQHAQHASSLTQVCELAVKVALGVGIGPRAQHHVA